MPKYCCSRRRRHRPFGGLPDRSRGRTHGQRIYVYILISCPSVIVTFASSRPRSNAMNAPSDCVTEVTLHSSLPVDELYQRLHQHLPTSPYTQGAIYSPIRDALQVPYQQGPSAVPNTNSTEPPPTALILLLRGDFKWRFGGELEQSSSPPWSWMSEELCGKPYPYIVRDFNSVYSSMVDTTSTPRCPYTTNHCSKAAPMLVSQTVLVC